MINVGIVGGTGYTGVELMRILVNHPKAVLNVITSRSNAGTAVSEMFPSLRGKVDLSFTEPNMDDYKECDLVFFATPNAIAMNHVEEMLEARVKVIDLAADFRLKDIAVWEKWYGKQHSSPSSVERAVYGMPEMNRDEIKSADLVANPGCYVTAVTLALLPLLKNNIINPATIVADGKSGVSGAGRTANIATLLCEASESIKAYAVSGHRHYPEIKQNLQQIDEKADLVFVPHLIPMTRGILATVYADVIVDDCDFQLLLESFYQNEPFVDVLPEGAQPQTRSVKGSNNCQIAIQYLPEANKVIVLSVIDNLVKGAAGQAVQNMNLMMSLDETMGLESVGLMP